MPQNQERGSSDACPVTAPPQPLPRKGRTPGDGDVICCGTPMELRLARARDRSGQEFFIAVWCCGHCGKIVY